MRLRGTMSIDQRGHLLIGGCDTVELAHQYGTPLYVIDEALLRQKAREYRRAFSHYMPGSEVIYAGKALLTSAICRIIDEEQLSLDVVSVENCILHYLRLSHLSGSTSMEITSLLPNWPWLSPTGWVGLWLIIFMSSSCCRRWPMPRALWWRSL